MTSCAGKREVGTPALVPIDYVNTMGEEMPLMFGGTMLTDIGCGRAIVWFFAPPLIEVEVKF